jgi:hypothetical protein
LETAHRIARTDQDGHTCTRKCKVAAPQGYRCGNGLARHAAKQNGCDLRGQKIFLAAFDERRSNERAIGLLFRRFPARPAFVALRSMHIMFVRAGFAHRLETPEGAGASHQYLPILVILPEGRVRGLAAEASALCDLFQFRHIDSYPIALGSRPIWPAASRIVRYTAVWKSCTL